MSLFERWRRPKPLPTPGTPVIIRGEVVRRFTPFEIRLAKYDSTLGEAYGEAISKSKPLDPDVRYRGVVPYEISLSDIPEGQREHRILQLKAKLTEYDERIKNKLHETQGEVKELSEKYRYRRDVLNLLLRDNSVNAKTMEEAYTAMMGTPPDKLSFYDAVAVVHGYVTNGGENLLWGTGLPNVQ